MQKPLSKTLCKEWSNLMSEFNVSAVDLSGILNTSAEEKAKQLPDPKTFHLLCVVPEAMEQYADSEVGIIKAGSSMHYEEMLTPVLFVVKVGPDAYKDETRFPSGPSCKEGDFIICRPNSGTRLKIHGREFRIINDDTVEAVVEDPRGITRAS
jgi:co-chaperonin GroES (HSP10)